MQRTVKERLIEFIKFLRISKNAFEKECDLSMRSISNCGKTPNSDTIKKILLRYPSLNPEWLMLGIPPMLKSNEPQQAVISQNNVIGDNNYNSYISHEYPVAHAAISATSTSCDTLEVECPNCGEVIEVQDTAIIPLIPAEVAKTPDLNIESWRHNYPQEMQEVDLRQIWGNGVFLIKVDTRAMEPEYREGTFLVLRKLPDISYARADGSAYVIDTMRPHTLFRYLSKERDGGYTLTAENDRRGPIFLKESDILNVYDIVGSFRVGR